MSALLRAPIHTGEWAWEFEPKEKTGLALTLHHIINVGRVLERHALLFPEFIEIPWIIAGTGANRIITRVFVSHLEPEILHDMVVRSQPQGYPEAKAANIRLLGPGVWLDGSGTTRSDQEILGLKVSNTRDLSIVIRVWTHRDIWASHNFHGEAQPEICDKNAPRLEAALRELGDQFGEDPDPAEPTYFGTPTAFGVQASHDGEGAPLDVTDKL